MIKTVFVCDRCGVEESYDSKSDDYTEFYQADALTFYKFNSEGEFDNDSTDGFIEFDKTLCKSCKEELSVLLETNNFITKQE